MRKIDVPYYKGLKIEAILEFGRQYPLVVNALPVQKECLKLERQYICDLIYTIVGDPFSEWVDERVNARN